MTRRGFAKRCSIWMAGKRHRASESSRVTHEGERMWRWLYDCRHAWDSAAPLSSREGALELPQRTRVHALRRRPRVSLTASRTRSFCVCPRRSLVSRDCLMSLEAHFCQSFSQQLVSRPVASSQNGRNCQYTCSCVIVAEGGSRGTQTPRSAFYEEEEEENSFAHSSLVLCAIALAAFIERRHGWDVFHDDRRENEWTTKRLPKCCCVNNSPHFLSKGLPAPCRHSLFVYVPPCLFDFNHPLEVGTQ